MFLTGTITDTSHMLGGRKVLFLTGTTTDTRHRLEGRKVLFLTGTITDTSHRLEGRKVLFLTGIITDTSHLLGAGRCCSSLAPSRSPLNMIPLVLRALEHLRGKAAVIKFTMSCVLGSSTCSSTALW